MKKFGRTLHSYGHHLNAVGVLCLVLCMVEIAWPYLGDYLPISPILFGTLSGLFGGVGILARSVLTSQLSGDSDADE